MEEHISLLSLTGSEYVQDIHKNPVLWRILFKPEISVATHN
jgi:hypothetical protein